MLPSHIHPMSSGLKQNSFYSCLPQAILLKPLSDLHLDNQIYTISINLITDI